MFLFTHLSSAHPLFPLAQNRWTSHTYISATTAVNNNNREPIANTLWLDLLGVIKSKTTKPEEWNKPPKYVSEPPIIGKIVPASPAVQLVMSCLDIAGVADGEAVAEWKYPLAMTPRDLETREVPLKEGTEFGEPHTVRVKQ